MYKPIRIILLFRYTYKNSVTLIYNGKNDDTMGREI